LFCPARLSGNEDKSRDVILNLIWRLPSPIKRGNASVVNSSNRVLVILSGMFALGSLCLFLIPAYVIRPFRYQSEAALRLAIAVKQIAPLLTVLLCVGLLATGVRLWRRSSAAGRTLALVALLVSMASAVMVRQNYFEWMFQPIAAAGFVHAADAHLSDKEMMMAVRIGPEARAYPIVQMAYHHILNDTVGTESIVVTY
jgi:Protein of unknown function (DUF3179)